jgi:hypothetical protein
MHCLQLSALQISFWQNVPTRVDGKRRSSARLQYHQRDVRWIPRLKNYQRSHETFCSYDAIVWHDSGHRLEILNCFEHKRRWS